MAMVTEVYDAVCRNGDAPHALSCLICQFLPVYLFMVFINGIGSAAETPKKIYSDRTVYFKP